MKFADIRGEEPVELDDGTDIEYEKDGETYYISNASFRLWSEEERNEVGYAAIEEIAPEEGKVLLGRSIEIVDGKVRRKYTYDETTASITLLEAQQYFIMRRDQSLQMGVEFNGNRWHTDPLSQHAMATAITLGQAAEAFTGQPWSVRWKTLTGRLDVGVQDLVMAGFAVAQRVQDAFAREEELDELAQTDIEAAWAQRDDGWPD